MRRAPILLASSLAVAGLSLADPAPRLIWNATASTPVGLYSLAPPGALRVGDLVAVRPPAPIAEILARGGFLPRGVLMLKPVAALPGQTICRDGDAIRIDGRAVGAALDRDHLRRALPRWSGCRRLRPGELFLMNPAVPQSLDGRYFGQTPAEAVVGRAQPIWTPVGRGTASAGAWAPRLFPVFPAKSGDFPWRPLDNSRATTPASPAGCEPSVSIRR